MPKSAKSNVEWEARILEFVAGKPFGQGLRPRKTTNWGKVLENIEKCPMRAMASQGRYVILAGYVYVNVDIMQVFKVYPNFSLLFIKFLCLG